MKSYCKHFGVDWRCAAFELTQLGVKIDADYLRQHELTEKTMVARRKRRKDQPPASESYESLVTTAFDAWLVEEYALHFSLWQEEEKGDFNQDAPF